MSQSTYIGGGYLINIRVNFTIIGRKLYLYFIEFHLIFYDKQGGFDYYYSWAGWKRGNVGTGDVLLRIIGGNTWERLLSGKL